jgi:hypothetical protein
MLAASLILLEIYTNGIAFLVKSGFSKLDERYTVMSAFSHFN